MQPTPPLVSPDGRFYLSGDHWVPFTAAPSARTVARGVATGIAAVLSQLVVALFLFPAAVAGALVAVYAVLPGAAADVGAVAVVTVLVGGLFLVLRAWR